MVVEGPAGAVAEFAAGSKLSFWLGAVFSGSSRVSSAAVAGREAADSDFSSEAHPKAINAKAGANKNFDFIW